MEGQRIGPIANPVVSLPEPARETRCFIPGKDLMMVAGFFEQAKEGEARRKSQWAAYRSAALFRLTRRHPNNLRESGLMPGSLSHSWPYFEMGRTNRTPGRIIQWAEGEEISMMKLLSVNVSLPKEVPYRGGTVSTGIFKEPVTGRVMLRRLNLDGDQQADPSVHGGVHKAAYAYPFEHYGWWGRELGRTDFTFGQFGENFTVEGMLEDAVRIGDVYRIGSALVEVTQPRAPCFKIGIRMGMDDFPKRFMASGRTGFYLKVLEEGEVGAGDGIERIPGNVGDITVKGLWHLAYHEPQNLEDARKALRLPSLAPEWRKPMEKRLIKAGIPLE